MSLVSERPVSGPPHYTGGSCKHSRLPKISLVSAMRDFQAMFPDLPPMVIEAVLRANGGAVDPTVEKLISMCCEQQRQEKKELDSDILPGYYEVIYTKEQQQPPPSYHASHTYADASTQTELSSDTMCKSDHGVVNGTLTEDFERLKLSDSQSSSTSDSSDVALRTDDEKMALYLQNRELIQQLKRKQRIIEYLERNGSGEQHSGTKPHRHSDPVMSLVPCFDGSTGVATQRVPHSKSRRTQTMSIQRQQNTSPPPNATVDSKEALDDHSMLPTITRNQPTRKSAKKRLQNLSKRLWRRNGGNDVPQVSPTSSQARLLQQDNDSISSYSVSHC